MSTDTAPVVVNNTVNAEPDDGALGALVELAPSLIEETKKGYKTTEFWLTVLGLVVVNVNGLVLTLPDKYQAIATAVLGGLYALSRGQAKKGIPAIVPAKPVDGSPSA